MLIIVPAGSEMYGSLSVPTGNWKPSNSAAIATAAEIANVVGGGGGGGAGAGGAGAGALVVGAVALTHTPPDSVWPAPHTGGGSEHSPSTRICPIPHPSDVSPPGSSGVDVLVVVVVVGGAVLFVVSPTTVCPPP
jgi:hypothetical protein